MISNKLNRTYAQYLSSHDGYSSVGSFVEQLEKSEDNTLVQQTIQEIRLVLSQDYPPLSKVLAIKLIKELFLLSKESIILGVQNKLLPEVAAIALYKDNQKGATFFNQTNFYISGDQRQKQTFKALGVDYLLFCKDSISAWASLIPFTSSGHPSKFAEKHTELKNKGVVFPKQRYLYRQSDKQIFQKVYKVQFFNEDSSLSESILNSSNCDIVVSRQLNQFQQLEEALKSTLQPQQQDTDWRKIKTIIERLNIFFHESSVKMLQELKDLNMPPEYTKRLLESQSKCGQLIEDYQYLKSNKIKYSRFYSTYGYVHNTPQKQSRLKTSNVQPPLFIPVSPDTKDMSMKKEKKYLVDSLNHQPIQLGKKIKRPESKVGKQENSSILEDNQQKLFEAKLSGMEDFYKQKIEEEKQNADLRIDEIKKLINNNAKASNSQEEWVRRLQEQCNPLRDKIQELYEDLKESEMDRQKLKSLNRQLENQLSQTQRQYAEKDRSLKKLLQQTERIKDKASNYEQRIEYLQKQVKQPSLKYAESKRESQISEASNKKLEKKIENLIQQKDMYREQLTNERGKNYQNVIYEGKLQKDEIERLKGRIKDKESKEREFLLKLDRIQIQNLKLKEQLKVKATISDSLKKQNEWITKTLNQMNSTAPLKKIDESVSIPRSNQSASTKLTVKDYLEVGIEGSTYYDVLPKQFRIKYKRSCFKKKQLLYKQYNMEIGVISEVKDSNTLSQTVFLTNYGTKDIHNVRVKVLNPTSNQIQVDTNHFDKLKQGEQHKLYLDASILHYPIGPVVLKLQYSDDQNQNTVQLLLPVTIIKLVRAITRHNPHLDEYKRAQFKYDHKMIQSHSVLKDYFPQVDFKTDEVIVLRMTIIHDHTRTQWNMDLQLDNDYVELRWSQVSTGFQEIQEYYCKTLRNLLAK